AGAIRAEIDDPAVVGTRVGVGDLGVRALGFPEHAEGRVQKRHFEVLAIEPLEALARIHGAEGRALHVGVIARRRDLGDRTPHRADHAEHAAADDLRRRAVDLEVLDAVGVGPQAQRALSVAGLEVTLPEIGRLENVSVGVDAAGVRKSADQWALGLGTLHRLILQRHIKVFGWRKEANTIWWSSVPGRAATSRRSARRSSA